MYFSWCHCHTCVFVHIQRQAADVQPESPDQKINNNSESAEQFRLLSVIFKTESLHSIVPLDPFGALMFGLVDKLTSVVTSVAHNKVVMGEKKILQRNTLLI